MANKTASLYLNIRKPNGKWTFARAAVANNGRLKPLVALIDEHEEKHPEAKYYLFWYEGEKRRSKPIGQDPSLALTELQRHERKLEYLAAGGKVKDDPERKRIPIIAAADEWIEDQKLFVGRDGQGMSKRTISAYRSRLDFFLEYCGTAPTYMDEIDERCLKDYIKFLQAHDEDYSDRYVYNIFQTLNTFLLANGILIARPLLAKLSFASKPVKPYTDEELKELFSAGNDEEKLVFNFFLNSGCREGEVAYTEYNDFNFKTNVLHIQPKADPGFRLKGKKNGDKSAKDRFVPIPAALMAKLKARMKASRAHLRDLVFPNSEGRPEGHFLRKLKILAHRAGLNCGRCVGEDGTRCSDHAVCGEWELHRFRKTFACWHHERNHVSVNTLREWLGHESLDVTLAYLKGSDAASEPVQEQVAKGALAVYV
ncbi:MAG: tyrosine-type recombinase/integrase [Candidatus Acidiferrum sp.]